MKLRWGSFGEAERNWTAIDAQADGGWVGVCVQGSAKDGKPRVMACVSNSAETTGVDALEEVARQLPTAGYACAMPLPRGDYQVVVVPEPPVNTAEMERSLRWTLGSMVDYSMEKANLAWMKIPAAQLEDGQPAQIYAVLARRTVVDEHVAAVGKAGLVLKAVDVPETAQRNLAALLERDGELLALVLAGPNGVTTTFTMRGELCLDRFLEQNMEELRAAGTAAQDGFAQRLASQLARSIDYVHQRWGVMVGRVVVGPMPQVPGVREQLAAALHLPVEPLNLAPVMDLSSAPDLAKPASQAPFLVALGSALRGARRVQ
jgi:MSHA biogenesis protein MshI